MADAEISRATDRGKDKVRVKGRDRGKDTDMVTVVMVTVTDSAGTVAPETSGPIAPTSGIFGKKRRPRRPRRQPPRRHSRISSR
jgi:hypothetical protein